jgi:hypothetical protein
MSRKRTKLFSRAVLPARGAMRWWYDKTLGRPKFGRGTIALLQALDIAVKGQKRRDADTAQGDLFSSVEPRR